MSKTSFLSCKMHGVDFSYCELNFAIFKACDLQDAIFEQTNLEKADFRTAKNYTIDPEKNRIKKAKFSMPEVVGLLAKFDIQIE